MDTNSAMLVLAAVFAVAVTFMAWLVWIAQPLISIYTSAPADEDDLPTFDGEPCTVAGDESTIYELRLGQHGSGVRR